MNEQRKIFIRFLERLPELAVVVALVFMLFFLVGCSSAPPEEGHKSLLETLEFEGDECGRLVMSGDVSAGTSIIPWFQSKVHVNYDKQIPCDRENEVQE